MDAAVRQEDGFRFVYTLPLSATRVLVEDTYFADGPQLDVPSLRQRALAYAHELGLAIARIGREETGILPLPALAAAPRASSPFRAGYAGGWFHPTTGYSFPIAARLALHGRPRHARNAVRRPLPGTRQRACATAALRVLAQSALVPSGTSRRAAQRARALLPVTRTQHRALLRALHHGHGSRAHRLWTPAAWPIAQPSFLQGALAMTNSALALASSCTLLELLGHEFSEPRLAKVLGAEHGRSGAPVAGRAGRPAFGLPRSARQGVSRALGAPRLAIERAALGATARVAADRRGAALRLADRRRHRGRLERAPRRARLALPVRHAARAERRQLLVLLGAGVVVALGALAHHRAVATSRIHAHAARLPSRTSARLVRVRGKSGAGRSRPHRVCRHPAQDRPCLPSPSSRPASCASSPRTWARWPRARRNPRPSHRSVWLRAGHRPANARRFERHRQRKARPQGARGSATRPAHLGLAWAAELSDARAFAQIQKLGRSVATAGDHPEHLATQLRAVVAKHGRAQAHSRLSRALSRLPRRCPSRAQCRNSSTSSRAWRRAMSIQLRR